MGGGRVRSTYSTTGMFDQKAVQISIRLVPLRKMHISTNHSAEFGRKCVRI